MEKVNRICSHPIWKECVAQIEQAEAGRQFCRHDVAHFLDVARIAYIENLEQRMNIPKEWIYAASLLHDIGRHLQYQCGTPHEQASADIARSILQDCGFDEESQEQILNAIVSHRNDRIIQDDDLAGILYRADKKSRSCMFCTAASECNWSDEKKNLKLLI